MENVYPRLSFENDRRNKLTLQDRAKIRKLYGKKNERELANMFGVNKSTISYWGNPKSKANQLEKARKQHAIKWKTDELFRQKNREAKANWFQHAKSVNTELIKYRNIVAKNCAIRNKEKYSQNRKKAKYEKHETTY